MFESKLPADDTSIPSDAVPPHRGLRPLSWGELVARLAVAQDLRAAPGDLERAREGSFDSGSARRIAAHRLGLEIINPDDLANGKTAGRTVVAGNYSEPATRGNT